MLQSSWNSTPNDTDSPSVSSSRNEEPLLNSTENLMKTMKWEYQLKLSEIRHKEFEIIQREKILHEKQRKLDRYLAKIATRELEVEKKEDMIKSRIANLQSQEILLKQKIMEYRRYINDPPAIYTRNENESGELIAKRKHLNKSDILDKPSSESTTDIESIQSLPIHHNTTSTICKLNITQISNDNADEMQAKRCKKSIADDS